MNEPPDLPGNASLGDAAFDEFQRRLLADFATKFDAWLVRAQTEYARPTFRDTSPLDETLNRYGKMMNGSIEADSEAITAQTDVVYELAELCRGVVTGDLWARAFLHRRQGLSIDEAIRAVTERIAPSLKATRDRRWLTGLRAIDGKHLGGYGRLWGSPLEDATWVQHAWDIVVKEAMPGFIDEVLRPALIKSYQQDPLAELEAATRKVASRRRERVTRFRVEASAVCGRQITNGDIARVADYGDASELKRYQRCDQPENRTATTKIESVLGMSPTAFCQRLDEIKTQADGSAEPAASAVKPEALTQKEVATVLGKSVRTIQRWIKDGHIKAVKMGHSVLIPRDEIKRLRATSSKTHP